MDLKEIRRLAEEAKTALDAYPTSGKHPTLEGIDINRKLEDLYKVVDPAVITGMVDVIELLRSALKDAVDTIHGEYCGCASHHGACREPSEKLQEAEGILK